MLPTVRGAALSGARRALGGRRGSLATRGLATGGAESGSSTHFGFKQVAVEDKEALVGRVFSSVAEQYDVMNDLMSGTLHRAWKDQFVDTLLPLAAHGQRAQCLDLAGGTGDIAFRIVERSRQRYPSEPAPEVVVADINQSMLDVGKQRAKRYGLAGDLSFVQQNAERLEAFADNSFDSYTIAFGIRNVTHIDRALAEAHRVLKPGGRFMCLEFSHLANPVLQQLYDSYSFNVIPAMGAAVAGDRESYQYLVESIRKFPRQREFERMIRQAGFHAVRHDDYTFGIVAVHSGFKL